MDTNLCLLLILIIVFICILPSYKIICILSNSHCHILILLLDKILCNGLIQVNVANLDDTKLASNALGDDGRLFFKSLGFSAAENVLTKSVLILVELFELEYHLLTKKFVVVDFQQQHNLELQSILPKLLSIEILPDGNIVIRVLSITNGEWSLNQNLPSCISNKIKVLSIRNPPSNLRQCSNTIKICFTIQSYGFTSSRYNITRFKKHRCTTIALVLYSLRTGATNSRSLSVRHQPDNSSFRQTPPVGRMLWKQDYGQRSRRCCRYRMRFSVRRGYGFRDMSADSARAGRVRLIRRPTRRSCGLLVNDTVGGVVESGVRLYGIAHGYRKKKKKKKERFSFPCGPGRRRREFSCVSLCVSVVRRPIEFLIININETMMTVSRWWCTGRRDR
ncbi:hypothetical protein AGLY_012158 [Aphis glycines]|uniref:Uncharacterized protein n=1 Tax=Aphis glycines TaxID=307491 RepID=A0A6G0T9B2_APHGL|nr:hypothetical protein AGLY_012158 [Aphis glycines]